MQNNELNSFKILKMSQHWSISLGDGNFYLLQSLKFTFFLKKASYKNQYLFQRSRKNTFSNDFWSYFEWQILFSFKHFSIVLETEKSF